VVGARGSGAGGSGGGSGGKLDAMFGMLNTAPPPTINAINAVSISVQFSPPSTRPEISADRNATNAPATAL
jgi:hypothetical protein